MVGLELSPELGFIIIIIECHHQIFVLLALKDSSILTAGHFRTSHLRIELYFENNT